MIFYKMKPNIPKSLIGPTRCIYLAMCVCMCLCVCVCVYVYNRCPNCQGYGVEIWYGVGVLPQEGFSEGSGRPDFTSWPGEALESFWRSLQPKQCFSGKNLKNKS